MNFRGPRLTQQTHNAPGGGTAHDRIVNQHHTLPRNDTAHRRKFHPARPSRIDCDGWMKVRPMYLFLISPIS